MRRQGQYADAGINSLVAGQMQQHERMRQNLATSHYAGRQDGLPGEDKYKYMAPEAEGQWQWDRDGTRGANSLPSHPYKEGHGSDASRSLYQGQRSDSMLGSQKQGDKDPGAQSHEQDMEVGYEETSVPQTFEGLEHKFVDEILKLTKEQQEAEDAEIARHRERISEINVEYQEKLMTIRRRQASNRGEFLRRETQIRHDQYLQAGLSSYPKSTGPSNTQGYGQSAAFAPSGHFDSYRERAQFIQGEFESRDPYQGGRGRAYDSGERYY